MALSNCTNGSIRHGTVCADNFGDLRQFTCPFCSNCNNYTCAHGTTGATCETCLWTGDKATSFARLGSACIPCHPLPWAVIGLAVFLMIIVAVMVKKGFSQSLTTKAKLLIDALQIILLTFRIPVMWPFGSLTVVSGLSFAYLNTQMSQPDCLYPDLATTYYLNWLSSLIPLILSFFLTWIMDRVMRRKLLAAKEEGARDKWEKKRTVLRRSFVLTAFLYYAPLTSLSLRSYACESYIGNAPVWYNTSTNMSRWMYNYDINCNSDVFQVVTFFSTFVIIFFSAIGPAALLFFTVRLRRWELLAKKAPLHGAMYESYRANWSFMEPIVLFRKLFLIVVADLYPLDCSFGPELQLGVGILFTVVYIIVIALGRPFRGGIWSFGKTQLSIHNVYEVATNILILGVQVIGIVIKAGQPEVRDIGSATDYILLSMIGIIIVLWLFMFLGQLCLESEEDDWEDLRLEEQEPQPIAALIRRATDMLKKDKEEDSTPQDEGQDRVLAELG